MFKKSTVIIFIVICFTACKVNKSGAYYMELSDKYWFKERLKRSYKYVLKAIKAEPKNDSFYVRAAYCYQFAYLKKIDTKLYDSIVYGYYNKSLELKPWNANALLSRAEYDLHMQRYELVIQYADSLLHRDKKNIDAYWYKARAYSSQGKFNKDSAKYFANFNEGIKNVEERDKHRLYAEIISNYLFVKNWEKAKYYFLISNKIKKEENTNDLAVCYYNLGQKDSACYYFKVPCAGYPCALYKDSIINYCRSQK